MSIKSNWAVSSGAKLSANTANESLQGKQYIFKGFFSLFFFEVTWEAVTCLWLNDVTDHPHWSCHLGPLADWYEMVYSFAFIFLPKSNLLATSFV